MTSLLQLNARVNDLADRRERLADQVARAHGEDNARGIRAAGAELTRTQHRIRALCDRRARLIETGGRP